MCCTLSIDIYMFSGRSMALSALPSPSPSAFSPSLRELGGSEADGETENRVSTGSDAANIKVAFYYLSLAKCMTRNNYVSVVN